VVRLTNQQNFLLCIVLAMCLRVAPFPHLINSLNPDWVLLVLIYWTLAMPYRKGVFNSWTVGLFTDVLTGRPLGEYALIYALISYFSLKLHKRLLHFPLIQQSGFIFVCLLTEKVLVFLIEMIKGTTYFPAIFWIPVLTGTLSWPVVHSVLRFIRHIGHSG
jgi:rod shape-determining protein MreD